MNYEQKYKEALERARGMMSYKEVRREDMEYLFPELKESEDERIRKQIISFLKEFEYDHYRSLNFSSWIAWLENQGEHKSIWHNEDEEPQKGSLILLIMQSGTPVVAKIIESNHTFNHGERWAYIDDLLESKSEQKPVDKVGPKFKDGDWVVFNGFTLYINEVVKGYYRTISKGGICNSYDWDIDNAARLWTLNEAKDGDVISFDNEGSNYHSIGIFKRIASKNELNGNTYRCYVRYGGFKEKLEIPINGNELHHCGTSAHPATKEQRDQLEKAMLKAGYKWDANKKELIKL